MHKVVVVIFAMAKVPLVAYCLIKQCWNVGSAESTSQASTLILSIVCSP